MKHARRKRLRHPVITGFLALMTGLLVLTGFVPEALAIKVTLKRVVFEGPRRNEVLTIVNDSAEAQTYRLGWRQMRMSENEALVEIEGPLQAGDPQPVDNLIRYAPRRVTIPAGGVQQVRLLLRKPADLADGEYRSHLWIQPEAEGVKFTPSETVVQSASEPVVQIKILTGITIPVIVRQGPMNVKAVLTDARAIRNPEGKNIDVSFTVSREGNRSLYGDLKFTCNNMLIEQIRGVAVYTEINKKLMNFSIPYPEGGADCSSVKIEYVAVEEDLDFKGAVLATVEATLQ